MRTFLLFIIFSFQHFLLLFTFLEVSRQQPCALPLRSRVPRTTSSPPQSGEQGGLRESARACHSKERKTKWQNSHWVPLEVTTNGGARRVAQHSAASMGIEAPGGLKGAGANSRGTGAVLVGHVDRTVRAEPLRHPRPTLRDQPGHPFPACVSRSDFLAQGTMHACAARGRGDSFGLAFLFEDGGQLTITFGGQSFEFGHRPAEAGLSFPGFSGGSWSKA